MYSGSTLTTYSGGIIGAHQKIDRVARRQLGRHVPGIRFPGARAILHFEGDNGPDGIKRKSPAKDEPWHYLQPFDKEDTQLIELIEDHYKKLVEALKKHDTVRSAFEAAWLSHAIVDGLTPAHHYPYEEKLVELRSGRSIETRNSVKEKILMPGENLRHQASNNWKFWGPKGLFTTHASFEWGVAMLIAPMRYRKHLLTPDKFDWFNAQSIGSWFREAAQDVARLELYDAFYETGWTVPLARRVRQQLVPKLICAVALVWYGAAREAGVLGPSKDKA
jgi:hypothetical protein